MTRRAVKDDEDSCETGPLVKLIALLCVAASVAATVHSITSMAEPVSLASSGKR